jgi:hypothetical protein
MAARFFWDLLLGWLAAVVLAGLIVLGWLALSLPARAQQPPTSNLVSGEASATTTADDNHCGSELYQAPIHQIR